MNGNELIGAKNNPSQYMAIHMEAVRARAYHNLAPYPNHAFSDWKTEERGKVPLCRPFVKNVVLRSSTWLFGKPISFICQDDEVKDLINHVWQDNHMGQQVTMLAQNASQSGGVFLTFGYNDSSRKKIKINALDAVDQVRLYFDPHDGETLLMARIQYPYWDVLNAKYLWHREEWTDDLHVIYRDIVSPGSSQGDYGYNPYDMMSTIDRMEWEEIGRAPNPFGIIPGHLVKNINNGGMYGSGDLWGLWPIIDNLNFLADLAHKDNQKKIYPHIVYRDVKAPPGADLTQGTAGIVDEVVSVNDKTGDVTLLESASNIREWIRDDYTRLMREFEDAAGTISLDVERASGNGHLTRQTMLLLFMPLIKRTFEKRQSWGEDGFCKFFERMSIGMYNLGLPGWKPDVDIQPVWPPMIEFAESEMAMLTQRLIASVDAGLTTRERAASQIARADGVVDIEGILADIANVPTDATSNTIQPFQSTS